ncbi:OmpW/AlkL family protein [Acinetobacter rudis]|uniref:OmpW family outer membrane protein n=1 Tax=Acinetobacter rudis TaxID=632955 RepID=A0AAW8JBE9_9GAMM|nr:OmpW family outer membrane protein [Acinetobacter rudis]MDQ8936272.1 OmpW family outer membrane protein [Acinetobacter rudis]MDQ8953984.1 OmpW family outer membrane protein [Acinetobacter rudis]MDQ9018534.1 OmpW family outer membrane protein [Acinetobacter rudis]
MFKQLALVALLGVSASAIAGPWQVKLGGSVLAPTSDTNVAGLGTVKADHEFNFTPSVEYFFNDNFSAELLLAAPFNQDVLLDGNRVAKVKHLPPTLTAKYNFKNSTAFTPYIGVGATAFIAWDESGVADKVKNDIGFAGQVGVNFKPADAKNWGVFVDVRYADLSPEVRLVEAAGSKKFDLDINPIVYTLGYSYRF